MKKTVRKFNPRKMMTNLIGVAVLVIFFMSFYSTSATGSPEVKYKEIVVHQGDTLWTIAKAHKGQEEIRTYIDQICESNDLDSMIIKPGQTLKIPQV